MNKICQLMSILGVVAGSGLGGPLAGQTFAVETSSPSGSNSRENDIGQSRASPQANIKLDLHDVPLSVVLDSVARQGNVRLLYNAGDPEFQRLVTRRITATSVETALAAALRETAMSFKPSLNGQTVLIGRKDASQEQMTGTVVITVVESESRKPVANATVRVDGDSKVYTAGADGTIRLVLSNGEQTIRIRAVGFTQVVKRVAVGDGQTVTVSVALERATSVLDEVVVTGTIVATERKAIPTPITVITAEEIEKRGVTHVEQLLRGEVPGVIAADQGSGVYSSSLGRMATSTIYTRGGSSIYGDATPLKTYIDGVEILDPSYLGTIDPQSIERIEIVTGPQAATVYGSGAMGGVMQVFTKKGAGTTKTEVGLSLKMGFLENSITNSFTPSHNDVLNVAGSDGAFSYAGTLSHTYTGQWIPKFYNRKFGGSLGVVYVKNALSATGSVATTLGKNGTFTGGANPLFRLRVNQGEWERTDAKIVSPYKGGSSSQTLSLTVDWRTAALRHSVSLGRSQTALTMQPEYPVFAQVSDTLLLVRESYGSRVTLGANSTWITGAHRAVSLNMTVGVTGGFAGQTSTSGTVPSNSAASYAQPSLTKLKDEKSWGGFARWQVGMFDQLYLTFGIRGERNPAFGSTHTVDWTPTNGLAYTFEISDVTVKLLGSYGRATRPPTGDMRMSAVVTSTQYFPSQWISRLENPELTPEYSRGPQMGIEAYYGNRASLSINHYNQTITDLIEYVNGADSVEILRLSDGAMVYQRQAQYQNLSKVKQFGWETQGSLNFGALSVKGTYSWMDSYILDIGTMAPNILRYPGARFLLVPTHTGNVRVSYSRGRTSATLATNFMGQKISYNDDSEIGLHLALVTPLNRHVMYGFRRKTLAILNTKPGYAKSDLSVQHRLSSVVSLSLNVMNVGNSYGHEAEAYVPTLGRTTTFGIQLRR